MNTSWCSGQRKSCAYDFLVDFAAGCDSPQGRDVAGCVFGRVHCSVLCDLPHITHLCLCAQYPLV
jgi:hypothetical protein